MATLESDSRAGLQLLADLADQQDEGLAALIFDLEDRVEALEDKRLEHSLGSDVDDLGEEIEDLRDTIRAMESTLGTVCDYLNDIEQEVDLLFSFYVC